MSDLRHELMERLRRALSKHSTIDVEKHAEAIAREVDRVRGHTRDRQAESDHAAIGEQGEEA